MQALARAAIAHPAFERAVISLILASAIIVGLETSPAMIERHGAALHFANQVVIALFVAVGDVGGGFGGVIDAARVGDKLRVLDFSFAFDRENVFWAGLVGGASLTLATHGTDQIMVERYLCARGRREAGIALVASGFVVLAQFALFLLIGVGLFVYYELHPPAQPFTHPDRVFAQTCSQWR